MADFIKQVTATQKKFRLVDVSIKNQKKGSLDFSINKKVKALQRIFRKFDIGATFSIVFPKLDQNGMATKDLAKFKANGDSELVDLFKDYLYVT